MAVKSEQLENYLYDALSYIQEAENILRYEPHTQKSKRLVQELFQTLLGLQGIKFEVSLES